MNSTVLATGSAEIRGIVKVSHNGMEQASKIDIVSLDIKVSSILVTAYIIITDS